MHSAKQRDGTEGSSDVIQLAAVSITVENPCELHHLGLFVNRIDNTIFALCDPKAGETPVGEVRELFRAWRARRATKTQDLEKDLAKTLRIGMSEIFKCVEDRF
jgi:hypothetical protein